MNGLRGRSGRAAREGRRPPKTTTPPSGFGPDRCPLVDMMAVDVGILTHVLGGASVLVVPALHAPLVFGGVVFRLHKQRPTSSVTGSQVCPGLQGVS